MQDSTLAHCRVTDKLEEGGMSEVWRAQDTKLGRSVAIKMLPASFSQDKDLLERFASPRSRTGVDVRGCSF